MYLFRCLNRSHHLLLSKKIGQLKEFKKESHITAFQTTEILTKKQVQFESLSDLKLKKAEEIKKSFVKAGEDICDNSATTVECKLPETPNVNIICKSVSQKKLKRSNIDKTPEDSTEEQLYKRQVCFRFLSNVTHLHNYFCKFTVYHIFCTVWGGMIPCEYINISMAIGKGMSKEGISCE